MSRARPEIPPQTRIAQPIVQPPSRLARFAGVADGHTMFVGGLAWSTSEELGESGFGGVVRKRSVSESQKKIKRRIRTGRGVSAAQHNLRVYPILKKERRKDSFSTHTVVL